MTASRVPEIVPLRREHLIERYGEMGAGPTIKGIAALLDGRVIAIAGFRLVQGKVWVVFCDLTDEARPLKVTMHRTALKLMAEAKTQHRRILAVCDEREPTAPRWLKRLGFEPDENG